MSIPKKMTLTPTAAVSVAVGHAEDSSGEFWQRVAGNLHVVYEGVPAALALELEQYKDGSLDTQIALKLVGYPRRVSS